MAKQVLAWRCKYCGALKKTENVAIRHEKACMLNPDRKNCIDCKHCYVPYGETAAWCHSRNIMCTKAVSVNCEVYEPKLSRVNNIY